MEEKNRNKRENRNKKNKGKYFIVLTFFAIMAFTALYINKQISLSESEKKNIEIQKNLEIENEKKKKEREKFLEEDKMTLRYPSLNSSGLVVLEDFTVSKKKIEEEKNLDNGVKDETIIFLDKVYRKVFEDNYLDLKFDKITFEEFPISGKKSVNVYLKGNYNSLSQVADTVFKEIIEKSAFQFKDISIVKVYLNNEIFNICFFDSKNTCAKTDRYFISKNHSIDSSGEYDNVIFDIENSKIFDPKNIEIKGVVMKDSLDFLPLAEVVGEARFFNSDNIFLGSIPIKNISQKKYLLDNKRVVQNKIDYIKKNPKEAFDKDGKSIDYEKVSEIFIFAKGSIGSPRTEDGYVVIKSDDDDVDNAQDITFQILYKK